MLFLNPILTGAAGCPFCPLLLPFSSSALTKNTREPLSPFLSIVDTRKNNNKRPYSLETANEMDTHKKPKAAKNCGPILPMRTFTPADFLHNADHNLWSFCSSGPLPDPIGHVPHEKEAFVCCVLCCICSGSKTVCWPSQSLKRLELLPGLGFDFTLLTSY